MREHLWSEENITLKKDHIHVYGKGESTLRRETTESAMQGAPARVHRDRAVGRSGTIHRETPESAVCPVPARPPGNLQTSRMPVVVCFNFIACGTRWGKVCIGSGVIYL